MAIDPSKYAAETKLIAPLYDSKLYTKSRVYPHRGQDGWYEVTMYGSVVKCTVPLDIAPPVSKPFRAVMLDEVAVLMQWDRLKLTTGNGGTSLAVKPVLLTRSFANPEPILLHFSHGRFFYVDIDYASLTAIDLQASLETGCSKHSTPEFRHLLVLERARQAALAAKEMERFAAAQEEEKQHRQLSITDTVRERFEQVGVIVLGVQAFVDTIAIRWQAEFYEKPFETILDRNTLMVKEAGYCASGDDKKFNITAVVKTAEEYAERGLVWQTRV